MLRLLGAALVTLSASLVGFGFARGVRRQCAQLEGLLWALDFMQSELSSRLTPLTQLFSMLDFLGVEKERTRVEWVYAGGALRKAHTSAATVFRAVRLPAKGRGVVF